MCAVSQPKGEEHLHSFHCFPDITSRSLINPQVFFLCGHSGFCVHPRRISLAATLCWSSEFICSCFYFHFSISDIIYFNIILLGWTAAETRVGLTGEWLGETCAGVSAPWRDRSSWLTWCVCRWAMFPWVHWQLCSWPGGWAWTRHWAKNKQSTKTKSSYKNKMYFFLITYQLKCWKNICQQVLQTNPGENRVCSVQCYDSLVCRVVCPSWSCGHVSQPWSAPASWPPLQPPAQCSQLPAPNKDTVKVCFWFDYGLEGWNDVAASSFWLLNCGTPSQSLCSETSLFLNTLLGFFSFRLSFSHLLDDLVAVFFYFFRV